jgi:CDP-paratose 2-epimerase
MYSSILITGGCGFVGSNLALMLKGKYPRINIVVMDNLMRRGSELNITSLTQSGITFIHGDVRNKEDFEKTGKHDLIIDASAEPSVMAGLSGGVDYLINTNFNGTINCLNFAIKNHSEFVFLSTSRVYSIEELDAISLIEKENRFEIDPSCKINGLSVRGINEDFRTSGSKSFYGASKFCSENFIEEYASYFGLKAIINRCGVIAGPRQYGKTDQGFMALWVAKHFWKEKLAYIGYGGLGKQVRDVMHISDLFDLIDNQLNHFEKYSGKIFNAGGGLGNSVSLVELTALCQEITGNKIQIDRIPETRKADIRLYISDNTRVTGETGWSPKKTVKDTVTDIYNWLRKDELIVKSIFSNN